MSLSEIKTAISQLTSEELAELAVYIQDDKSALNRELHGSPDVKGSFADRYAAYIGVADDLPCDLAVNLDSHLHGLSKK